MPAHKHTAAGASSASHYHFIAYGATGGNYDSLSSSNYLYRGCKQIDDWSENYRLAGGGSVANVGRTSGANAGASNITVNNTGGGAGHNTMQPYITVYCWKRTA